MDDCLFAIMDSDGACLETGLEFFEATETLLTLDDHDFDFIQGRDGLLELVWGPRGRMRPTGIRAYGRSDLLLYAASRDEPWNGRRVTTADAWGPGWWSITQPGRPPFYFNSEGAEEAYDYCDYLNRLLHYRKEAAFEIREVTADEEIQRASRNGPRTVEQSEDVYGYRTVFPIDEQLPVVLRDLVYPDRLFECTSRVFLYLDIHTKRGLVSGGIRPRIRIDENYIGWKVADWHAVIESTLHEMEDTYLGWRLDLTDPATTVTVSLRTMAREDILLWRREGGIVDDTIEIDPERLRDEIRRKIASVPDSGRTDCLRQAALSSDSRLEIKCKPRGLHLLSRSHVSPTNPARGASVTTMVSFEERQGEV
ncbi:hypothetical protein [Rhizobium sp. P007]|uniref:hypothetical protein n=1 Tax=Rhizobium sp. P007 TaxID=285908 RepID=UPI001157FFF6|nr:hypothetical protein [Rhizobium sp. P007]CAD7058595.1 hypothetical protein RP007_02599 [Rhizobium sp. P007]